MKLDALKKADCPKNVSELHSFLGLSVYASRWIKDLSTLSEPLWKLTKKDVRWNWCAKCQMCFEKIKKSLIDNIGFFNLNWDTQVTVDASPVGLGAVLTQSNPDNKSDKRVICCVSRTLSETEKKYSQIEKEAYAIVWACERLELYLVGNKFDLYTDNKALSLIINNPLAKPPARIQRWELRISSFNFNIIHRPGKGNISDFDFLSRHPLALLRENTIAEDYVNMIIRYTFRKLYLKIF